MLRTLLFSCFALIFGTLQAQQIPAGFRTVTVSAITGPLIDAQEKSTFGLFPYYSANDFVQAQFTRTLAPDSAVVLYTLLRDGRTVTRAFSEADFRALDQQVATRVSELYRSRNGQSRVSAPVEEPEIVGQSYSVDLVSGSSFIGTLTATSFETLEFDTKDLGHLRIMRSNIRQLVALTQAQTRRGWAPVGNGTRVFFSPTARNLRAGEGYVQSVDIFFLGVNYGLSDNVSLGAFALLPLGFDEALVALTPKVSIPVGEKLHIGAGALVARAFSTTFGIGYGLGTYGTADQNVSLGLGYAFTEGEVASTPVVVVSGATRVSKRISLLNETYIVEDEFFGLIGLRVAGAQVSGSLGFVYGTSIGGFYPAYAEVAYRFGRTK